MIDLKLIDTHAHVYSQDYGEGNVEMVREAIQAGVSPILMPAIDSTTHPAMLELEKLFPGDCISMMGLHPCSVTGSYLQELAALEQHFNTRPFVAVGETGLDFYWDVTYKDEQYAAFRRQIEWAKQYGIPVVIHSRSATDECIEVIREMQDGSLKGVFHCFSGTEEQAKDITALGFYLGIGGVLTFKNSGLDRAIANIDLSRLVLETDAPYLAPVPYRGKQNRPSMILHVAQKLADLRQMPLAEVATITTANAKNLFAL